MSDTKQKILDAAEHLFAAQGYSATSLRQIIAEAGVNLASVHYHFGSKEGIVTAVLGRIRDRQMVLFDRLRQSELSTPGAICRAAFAT